MNTSLFRRSVRSHVFRLLVAVVLTSLAAAAWSGETPKSRFFALCIGLRYPGTDMALEYSASDSRKVADAFRKASGYNAADTAIVALVDDDPKVEKPTRQNILDHLREMAAQSRPGDRLVVFYSGHGVPDAERRASIVASGARGIRDEQNLVRLSEIKEIMASSPAENKLLIIDACHSGGGKSLDNGVTPDDIARALTSERGAKGGGADVAWLSSCQASERSWEDDELKQGVFTHFLLDALGPRSRDTDISRDGMISVEELHFAIEAGISDYLVRKFGDDRVRRHQRRQRPQVGWGGGVAGDTEQLRRVNVFFSSNATASATAHDPRPDASAATLNPTGGLPKTQTLDLGNGVTMEFALIPAGKFMMGSSDAEAARYKIRRKRLLSGDFLSDRLKNDPKASIPLEELSLAELNDLLRKEEEMRRERQEDNRNRRRYLEIRAVMENMGLRTEDFDKQWRQLFIDNYAETLHEVEITRSYYIGIYEVSQAQYEAVMDMKVSPGLQQGDDLPVVMVDWYDATEFCETLSIIANRVVRLPTEAEWEYACRAGTTGDFNFGSPISPDQANYKCQLLPLAPVAGKTYEGPLKRVSSFSPNRWGLYNMHGNVREWCSDLSGSYSGPAKDPQGASFGWCHIVRGGGYTDEPELCRSASREFQLPTSRTLDTGFRVVFEP